MKNLLYIRFDLDLRIRRDRHAIPLSIQEFLQLRWNWQLMMIEESSEKNRQVNLETKSNSIKNRIFFFFIILIWKLNDNHEVTYLEEKGAVFISWHNCAAKMAQLLKFEILWQPCATKNFRGTESASWVSYPNVPQKASAISASRKEVFPYLYYGMLQNILQSLSSWYQT